MPSELGTNRTTVGLKPLMIQQNVTTSLCTNRTTVGLKPAPGGAHNSMFSRTNRTTVGLKHEEVYDEDDEEVYVLIEPRWD